jgi:hypothetical protein
LTGRRRAITNPSYSMARVLAWLVGGLSLVSLVQLSISLRLHASVQLLIDSYRVIVAELFGLLTGWIGLAWFNVSELERHFIIIVVICQSALLARRGGLAGSTLYAWLGIALLAVLDTIVFGIMPDGFILTPVFTAVVMLFLPIYLERTGEWRLEGYSANLVGITMFFLIITSINYVMTAF